MDKASASQPPQALPEILAPAGDKEAFLAALAAGADGIYLGLKQFSARMEAQNFATALLARLVSLAHNHNCKVYVAMNTIIKPRELNLAYKLVRQLATSVRPDGLIIQDAGLIDISRQANFDGIIAFSTLANISDPSGLAEAKRMGASRVILPRELSLDEIRLMGETCPPGLELECFVHGALCYCVSGRCYWSSYMGGKSGLRGRCVQPCRRMYSKAAPSGSSDARIRRPQRAGAHNHGGERFFSCQDLSLAPGTDALLAIPHLASWKIEGRKKGPHYVYHAVTAYKLLRDNPSSRQTRKMAQEILQMGLGRPGVQARFLPQKKHFPMAPRGQTSSGLLAGKVNFQQNGKCMVKPHFTLLPRDYLRIGIEDENWHSTLKVTRMVPKGGSLPLPIQPHKTPKAGTPVYLIDRREPELEKLLKEWNARLDKIPEPPLQSVVSSLKMPAPAKPALKPDFLVARNLMQGKPRCAGDAKLKKFVQALWLSPKCAQISRTLIPKISFWLPPVVWPDNSAATQKLIRELWNNGARNFVCNAPWQRAYFPASLPTGISLIAGPFCNAANAAAIQEFARAGFTGAFASPELSAKDFLFLPKVSPLPMGIVLGGYWPVGISRFGITGINVNEPFASPKNEIFWARDYGSLIWIYPGWNLDLSQKRTELAEAGYSFFAWLDETPPKFFKTGRQGTFNWNGALL